MDRDRWIVVGITLVGIAMACAPLLQAVRVRQRKSSVDVSLATFLIFGGGNLAWLAYGYYREDWPIMITNSVAALTAMVTIGIALRYR